MYGIYICLPTTQQNSEVTEPQTDSQKADTSHDAANADKKLSSSASSSRSNKSKALLDAITIVEARSLLEPLIGSLLHISPRYIFKKIKSGDFRNYYECLMIIEAEKPLKEDAYQMFEGRYMGKGLSKRLAQMDACKNAMLEWDEMDGVLIGEMSFVQYVKAILRDIQRK